MFSGGINPFSAKLMPRAHLKIGSANGIPQALADLMQANASGMPLVHQQPTSGNVNAIEMPQAHLQQACASGIPLALAHFLPTNASGSQLAYFQQAGAYDLP